MKINPQKEMLMTGNSIQNLRETLSLGLIDLYWLVGVGNIASPWELVGEKKYIPLQDVSLSILVRYLCKYHEESYMPVPPEYQDIFDLINETDPSLFANRISKEKIAIRRFAPLFGKSDWNSQQWASGKSDPSSVVNRLFLLVWNNIKQKGEAGLKEYLQVVEEELIARKLVETPVDKSSGEDLVALNQFLKKGAWKTDTLRRQTNATLGFSVKDLKRNASPRPVKLNNSEHKNMPDFNQLMQGKDIQILRETLEIGLIDTYWITGTGTIDGPWRLNGEESFRPITDPSLSILVRFLLKYPEMSLIPKFPNFKTILKKILAVNPKVLDMPGGKKRKKITTRRFASLFGKSDWNTKNWEQGISEPTGVVQRLFYIVDNAIKNEGAAGLQKYIDILDEEARARGLSDGYKTLQESGTWEKRQFLSWLRKEY